MICPHCFAVLLPHMYNSHLQHCLAEQMDLVHLDVFFSVRVQFRSPQNEQPQNEPGVGIENIDSVAPLVENPHCSQEHECPICLQLLGTNDVRRTLCHHEYCSQCITRWFEKHRTCPVCKTDLALD